MMRLGQRFVTLDVDAVGGWLEHAGHVDLEGSFPKNASYVVQDTSFSMARSSCFDSLLYTP
ncbi:MAG: hypothetical protein ACR2JB_06710 [Bryobacteraceae bacterium]